MDRAERATPHTLILFHLGELSQLSKVVPHVKMPGKAYSALDRGGDQSLVPGWKIVAAAVAAADRRQMKT
jgi:hypothetical protein